MGTDGAGAAPVRPGRGKRAWVIRAAAAVGALIWVRAFLAGPASVPSVPIAEGPKHRASGVVHIHTNLSDGRGTPAVVIAAARRAGADFIVVTDHNRVDPEEFDRVAQQGDPLVMFGDIDQPLDPVAQKGLDQVGNPVAAPAGIGDHQRAL